MRNQPPICGLCCVMLASTHSMAQKGSVYRFFKVFYQSEASG
ncbi:MAG: hypothetical protein ACLQFM_09785 [Terriglobales bacterium]